MIVDQRAETKVAVNDDVALGDAALFRSQLDLRRLLHGGNSTVSKIIRFFSPVPVVDSWRGKREEGEEGERERERG